MHTDERSHFGAPGDFMTVRHLTLRGTNAEIGRAVAEIAQRRHGASLEDLRADPVFVRARRDFLRGVYPLHWQRVRGVAEAFGVDPDGDEYDLTTLTYNMTVPAPAMGCSVVYYPPATTTDGGLLSRNYRLPDHLGGFRL